MGESILEGGGLRLVFVQVGDRLGHRIESIRGDRPEYLLESVEGTPAEAWPASPPLQNLHIEHRAGDRQVALLVGMAGRSHWSLSVELEPERGQLTFDVACRLRESPEFLGTTYATTLPVSSQPSAGVVVLGPTDQGTELAIQPPTEGEPSSPTWQYDGAQRQLRLGVVPCSSDTARTMRWQYTIRHVGGK